MKNVLLLSFVIMMGTVNVALAQNKHWPEKINGINLYQLEKNLQGEGITGWIHAAVPMYNEFVFTYRDPKNFFRYVNLSLLARGKARKTLRSLRRHDRVTLKGKFAAIPAPIPHIIAADITINKKYVPNPDLPPYKHKMNLPAELSNMKSLKGKIHATFNGGRALVIEYKDAVIPVFIKEDQLKWTANLYRNDLIEIHYIIQDNPGRPTHLNLDPDVQRPLIVMDEMVKNHGKAIMREGILAMFPKSPQIKFNIFALKVVKERNNTERNYTLVNFADFDLFMKVLKKLQKKWDENRATAVNGRNHFYNPEIRIRAKGLKNVVAPSQANPQIMINSLEDIEFI